MHGNDSVTKGLLVRYLLYTNEICVKVNRATKINL